MNNDEWLLQYSGYIKMEYAFELSDRIDNGDYSVPDESIDEGDVRVYFINTTKVFKEFLDDTGYFENIVESLFDAKVSDSVF